MNINPHLEYEESFAACCVGWHVRPSKISVVESSDEHTCKEIKKWRLSL
jgi:hypothetical protein